MNLYDAKPISDRQQRCVFIVRLTLSAAMLLPAQAWADPQPFTCHSDSSFPEMATAPQLATVGGAKGQRLYFVADTLHCPSRRDQCRQSSYVLAGDHLLISRIEGNWACAWYQGRRKEVVGWVSLDRLRVKGTDTNPTRHDWSGIWHFYDQEINIELEGARDLALRGRATWNGGKSSAGYDIVNTGEHEGVVTPSGTKAKLPGVDELDCSATLLLIGRYLIVADNMHCGGLNVRFNGVYLK